MSTNQLFLATIIALTITAVVYAHSGINAIANCYKMWLERSYWTNYNVVEAVSWFCKAVVIVPGLVFGINIWQLYFFTLLSSAMLIWASNKKLLPTLVGFNTLWIWLSCAVLAQHLFN